MIRNLRLRYFLLFSTAITLVLGWLITSSGFAADSLHPGEVLTLQGEDQSSPTQVSLPTDTAPSTPDETNAIALPIIQQDASIQTIEAPGAETSPPTITPTPIPTQSSKVNVPIVFGAIVIVIIIILAWMIVSRRLFEKKD